MSDPLIARARMYANANVAVDAASARAMLAEIDRQTKDIARLAAEVERLRYAATQYLAALEDGASQDTLEGLEGNLHAALDAP